jgi:hypothetical protein
MAGKLGKLPARKDSVTFKLVSYLNMGQAPQAPTSVSAKKWYPKAWDMLGNDQFGDCVWAGAAHETMLWNDEAKRIVTFTDNAVLSDYSAVTGFNVNDPNSDQGTDMQVAASYRRKTGIVDSQNNRHKVAAYLALTPKNVAQLKQAIYLFGAVGVGIEFPDSAMTQFDQNKPWSVVKGASIEGGHYIAAVGYTKEYVYVVTWGKVIRMTWAFFEKYNDESVVYLSEEMLTNGLTPTGFNEAQLQADLKAL